MRDYRMIALAYNKSCEGKGEISLEKLLDISNGFFKKGDKFIWSRRTKLLDDLKDYIKNNPGTDNCAFVTRLKYSTDRPSEYDQLFGAIYSVIKNTDISVIVLLECQHCKEQFTLQDFQSEYGTDDGLEMFFALIVAEEENEGKIKTRILKNKCGALYAF